MKYYNFYRESDDFADILSDINIKKYIKTKIRWKQHLTFSIPTQYESHLRSYITLKYGDEMINDVVRDFSPIPDVDYIPHNKIVIPPRMRNKTTK